MKHKTKKTIYNVIVIAIVITGITAVSSKFIHLGNVEFTENAQIKQLIVPVNSRVQGFVKEIRFVEYQAVKKGDTLAIIEDTEFIVKMAQAEADLQKAMAGKMIVNSSVNTAQNNIAVSAAAIEEVKTMLVNAETEYIRYKNLLAKESVTQQEFDVVQTRYQSLKARYETLRHQKESTILVKDEQYTRLSQNNASIRLAKAALDLAKLNLSYTIIVAPADGYTGRKTLQVGQLIQPGQTIVDLVDNNDKWVIANYKETQTHHIHEGGEVELKVDALPDVVLKGRVQSISNATGASFSVVPQDNSAGNFVKVEQRIPVRIAISKENNPKHLSTLRAGMNVACTVKY